MASDNNLFNICKILLIISGVWSQKIPYAGPFYQYLYKIYAISSQIFYTSSIINFGVELYKLLSERNIDGATENVSRMIFVGLVSCKLRLCHSEKIIKLFKLADVEEKTISLTSHSGILKIYFSNVKYCNTVVILLTVFSINAGSIFILDGLYDSFMFYKRYSGEEQTCLQKPFPLPLWYPFDKNKYYFWAIFHQVVNITQSVLFNIAVQALIHSVMVFIKTELKILQHKIKNLNLYDDAGLEKNNNSKENDDIFYVLKLAVKKHQELISWVEQFNESIKYLLLLEYCVTSLMLASTLIQIIQNKKVTFNIFFFVLCLIQIFALAWNANEILLESSTGLHDALYNSKWYEQSPQSKILIFFMMMRCRRPLALTIGPFGPMTVDAAVSRVKLAYTFLSVMSTN
nr:odorant receptor 21 [Pachyrhinus yasumatsui]